MSSDRDRVMHTSKSHVKEVEKQGGETGIVQNTLIKAELL